LPSEKVPLLSQSESNSLDARSHPITGSATDDSRLQQQKRHHLDRLYQRVVDDVNALITAVGLKVAA
jgi:hypothetical protein